MKEENILYKHIEKWNRLTDGMMGWAATSKMTAEEGRFLSPTVLPHSLITLGKCNILKTPYILLFLDNF